MVRTAARIKRFLPGALGERLLSFAWRHFWEAESRRNSELDLSGEELQRAERGALLRAIGDAYPFRAALEVGCAYGQNLHLLCPLFPDATFLGVDKNRGSVDGGQRLFDERLIRNGKLIYGDGTDLSAFADNSFDIVYTSASLLYVRAEQIEKVIQEMMRCASRKLILLEQHLENDRFPEQWKGTYVQRAGGLSGYWLRDYQKLLERFVPKERIRFTKVPHAQWQQEQWSELGYVIEVELP